jgi:putative membrane protein
VTTVSPTEVVPGPSIETDWRRLSIRMLAVHPVTEFVRALPAVIALLLVGSQREGGWWYGLVGVVAPVLLGLVRWATTRYRITPTQIEVRRGLLGRSVLTVPRDRVRSVDLTSNVMHRLLGLTRIAIGTGQVDRKKDSGLMLDGLGKSDALRLREELLHSGHAVVPAQASPTPQQAAPTPQQAQASSARQALTEAQVAILDPAWIRYGPFTLSGLVILGVAGGFAWRTINEAHLNPDRIGPVHTVTNQLAGLPIALAGLEVALIGLVLVALTSTLAYVLAFWNFRLTRTSSHTLHVSRGLLTTRSTTIEERRLRGVEILEPLLLRSAGGARATAITTGLRRGRGGDRSISMLLPPAPVSEARRVAADVLGDDAPVTVMLSRHSAAAKRRRVVRALFGSTVVIAAAGFASWQFANPWWVVAAAVIAIPAGLWLARDRFASLGHAVVGRRLVFRVGSVVRRRSMIDSEGVIGWKIGQSFFQRRAGLVTLTATTAAGRQAYALPDVDDATAVSLADQVLPGLLEPFLVPVR